jgi:hypothetical protein
LILFGKFSEIFLLYILVFAFKVLGIFVNASLENTQQTQSMRTLGKTFDNDMGIKKNFYGKLITARYFGIRKEVRYLFVVSFVGIIVIEFWFNKYYPIYPFQYDFGNVFLKLCYSYVSAFVFYFLIVYSPKERKRVKSFRFVNNKINRINNLIQGVIIVIFKASDPTIEKLSETNFSEFQKYFDKVNPVTSVEFHETGIILHKTYYEFLNYKMKILESNVQQLILINDLLNDELFLNLVNMNDIISKMFPDYKIGTEKSLIMYSHSFYELNFERKELIKNFRKDFHPKYSFIYHYYERKRNLRK